MQDMNWIQHPALKQIHPKKLEIIIELIRQTEGKPIAQSIPHLMKANQTLNEAGLSFSEEETSLIMDLLTKDMSAAEKQQVAKMKDFIKARLASS